MILPTIEKFPKQFSALKHYFTLRGLGDLLEGANLIQWALICVPPEVGGRLTISIICLEGDLCMTQEQSARLGGTLTLRYR